MKSLFGFSSGHQTRNILFFVAIALVIASFIFYLSQSGSFPFTSDVRFEANPPADRGKRENLSSVGNSAAISVTEVEEQRKPSPEELHEIDVRSERTEAVFRQLEKASMKILAEIDSEDGQRVSAIAIIPTPSGAEYAAYTDVISKEFDGLSDFVKNAAFDAQKKLLDKYTAFPAMFRVIQLFWSRQDATTLQQPSIGETYITQEDGVSIKEDSVQFRGVKGERNYRQESVPRYGHLFDTYLQPSEVKSAQK